jgi:hypothetical protein
MNITQLIIISILIITLLILYFDIFNFSDCNIISNNYEFFNMFQEQNLDINYNDLSFKKLYYDIDCSYIKKGCFYEALQKNNFKKTDNLMEAALIMPCTYETTDKEFKDIQNKNISKNIYGKNVRIFMLKNTDYLVSKIVLWIIIKNYYGAAEAAKIMPYTWNLNSKQDVNDFKKNFEKNKLYIVKNNTQRQEGLLILDNLESIINSNNKYLLVQELLQDPYLINGRKINLRVYCLFIKNYKDNIKICIYKDGFMYYTPDLFQKNTKDFSKNITTGYIDRKVYQENPLTHNDFRVYLDSNRNLSEIEKNVVKKNIKLSEYIFTQIYELLKSVFYIYTNILSIEELGIGFQLYGADIAINDNLNPSLMEINKGPDLTAKDGRDKELKLKLSEDILKCVGLLPNEDNNFITVIDSKKE